MADKFKTIRDRPFSPDANAVTVVRKDSKAGKKFEDEFEENVFRTRFSGDSPKNRGAVARSMAANTIVDDAKKAARKSQFSLPRK